MEKKLTDEEIVKALGHCMNNRSCEYCNHNYELGSGEIVCRSRLMWKTVYLIQRQKDIIQKQCDFVEKLEADYGKLVEENADLTEERENMEREILALHKDLYDSKQKMMVYHINEIDKAVKDTAKEALEQFIIKLIDLRLVSTKGDMYYEFLETKDYLLKEKYGVEVE